jgi:hypothetical protein
MNAITFPRAVLLLPGLLLVTLLVLTNASAAPTDDVYRLGPESHPQDREPKATVNGP